MGLLSGVGHLFKNAWEDIPQGIEAVSGLVNQVVDNPGSIFQLPGQMAEGMAQAYAPSNLGDTLYNDPLLTGLDAFGLFALGRGAARRLPGMLADESGQAKFIFDEGKGGSGRSTPPPSSPTEILPDIPHTPPPPSGRISPDVQQLLDQIDSTMARRTVGPGGVLPAGLNDLVEEALARSDLEWGGRTPTEVQNAVGLPLQVVKDLDPMGSFMDGVAELTRRKKQDFRGQWESDFPMETTDPQMLQDYAQTAARAQFESDAVRGTFQEISSDPFDSPRDYAPHQFPSDVFTQGDIQTLMEQQHSPYPFDIGRREGSYDMLVERPRINRVEGAGPSEESIPLQSMSQDIPQSQWPESLYAQAEAGTGYAGEVDLAASEWLNEQGPFTQTSWAQQGRYDEAMQSLEPNAFPAIESSLDYGDPLYGQPYYDEMKASDPATFDSFDDYVSRDMGEGPNQPVTDAGIGYEAGTRRIDRFLGEIQAQGGQIDPRLVAGLAAAGGGVVMYSLLSDDFNPLYALAAAAAPALAMKLADPMFRQAVKASAAEMTPTEMTPEAAIPGRATYWSSDPNALPMTPPSQELLDYAPNPYAPFDEWDQAVNPNDTLMDYEETALLNDSLQQRYGEVDEFGGQVENVVDAGDVYLESPNRLDPYPTVEDAGEMSRDTMNKVDHTMSQTFGDEYLTETYFGNSLNSILAGVAGAFGTEKLWELLMNSDDRDEILTAMGA